MGVEDGAGAAENTWGDGSDTHSGSNYGLQDWRWLEVEGRLPGGGGRG